MALVHRFRPVVTIDNETFDSLYGIQHDEAEKLTGTSKKIFNNTFIKTADPDGIIKYEELYEITPDVNMNYEERRKVVIDKMLYKPPFTEQRLGILLENVLGDKNFGFVVDPANFTVVVSIPAVDRKVYNMYVRRIREIIPANMLFIPATPYTYLYLTSMNYGDAEDPDDVADPTKLVHYTYRELSKYSIFDKTVEMFAVDDADDISISGLMMGYVCDTNESNSIAPSYVSEV